MKRIPKPFTVEVKRSRVLGRGAPGSKRLFGNLLGGADVALVEDVRSASAESASEAEVTKRVLPSLIEPRWTEEAPAGKVGRRRSASSGAKERFEAATEAAVTEEPPRIAEEPANAEQMDVPAVEQEVHPATEIVGPDLKSVPVETSTRYSRMRRNRYALEALPRGERWKRRLPRAAW